MPVNIGKANNTLHNNQYFNGHYVSHTPLESDADGDGIRDGQDPEPKIANKSTLKGNQLLVTLSNGVTIIAIDNPGLNPDNKFATFLANLDSTTSSPTALAELAPNQPPQSLAP